MATFIKSQKIDVFPAVNRAVGYANAKRTTEENLLKLNKISGNERNLAQMFFDPQDAAYVIFNIYGYWFRCKSADLPSGANLKAYIKLIDAPGVGYMLSPIEGAGTLLDQGALNEEDFCALGFTTENIPSGCYGLQIRDGDTLLIEQPLKLDANEIRNVTSGAEAISKEFTTETITADIINGLTITPATNNTLTIIEGKTLVVNKNITLDGTDGKSATLNNNLTISGADKTLAGAGTLITIGGNFETAGAHSLTLTTTDDTNITLPTAGTLVTKTSDDALSNKTITLKAGSEATPPLKFTSGSILTTAAAGSAEYDGNRYYISITENTRYSIPMNTAANTLLFSTTATTTATIPSGAVTLVTLNDPQILTQKTLTSPVINTPSITQPTITIPKIKSATEGSNYNIAVNALVADRTISLPSLLTNDTFVFEGHNQTLTNKTLTSPDINGGTADMLTSLSVRDKLAAYDLEIKSNSLTNLTSNRSLTLDVSDGNRTIKLTGSPTLSGITTTGTGTIALGTNNLTISDNNKTIAGTGTSLTIDNDLDIGGTTGQITLGSTASTDALVLPHPTQYGIAYGSSATTYAFSSAPNSTGRALLGNSTGAPYWTPGILDLQANLTIGTLTFKGPITIASNHPSAARGLTLGGTDSATSYNINPFASNTVLYASAPNTIAGITKNITTTKKFLIQFGDGSAASAPVWDTLVASYNSGSSSGQDYVTDFTADGTTITKTKASFNSLTIGTGLSGTSYNPKTSGTTIALTDIAAGSSTTGALSYKGISRTEGYFYGGDTKPTSSTRLNYDGHFHATKMVTNDLTTSTGELTLSTAANNANIKVTPNGTGAVLVGTVSGFGSGSNYKLQVAGNVYISENIYFPSDARLKTKIDLVDTTNILNGVENTEVWKFAFKKNNEENIGVMAQDIINNFPEYKDYLVAEGYDPDTGLEDRLTIKENKFIYVLWAALQEETKKRKQLETKLDMILEKIK